MDNSKVMEEDPRSASINWRNCPVFKTTPLNPLPTKMAENPAGADLTDLAKRASCKAKELAYLRAFAKANLASMSCSCGISRTTAKNKKQHLYSISDADKPRPGTSRKTKRVNGLFEVVKLIHGITAKERKDVDVWHRTDVSTGYQHKPTARLLPRPVCP
ncbi:hypothetical protein ACLB1T_09825 [Escherichia coli]